MAVSLGQVPVEECLVCCQFSWFQRESEWRRGVKHIGHWWYGLWGANWNEPSWLSERLAYGTVFVGNVDVADYFCWMYGLTPTRWLEGVARRAKLGEVQVGGGEVRYGLGRGPTPTERLEIAATNAFAEFCQSSANSKREAEPVTAPNAAPPHR